MINIIELIKEKAQKASEDYLLFGDSLNDAIVSFHQSGEIDNDEILKRICEQANQNVYLGIFNDDQCDKSNIQFPIADFTKIKEQTQKSEQAMKEYQTPPGSFKSLLSNVVTPPDIEQVTDSNVKLAELNNTVEYRTAFRNLHGSMETLKHAEMRDAENAFNKLAHETKIMVANGESIGDIAKIAARYVKEQGLDMNKIASAYDIVHKELMNSGFSVKTDFTKVSSLKVNPNSEMLKPVNELVLSLEKIAALDDMCNNISKVLNAFDGVVNEQL